jgi:hypothetical protein
MAFPAAAPAKYSVYREQDKIVVSRAIPGASDGVPLPPLCVKCGGPSAGTLSRIFYWHAPWVYVFVLFGLLPYAVLAILLRKRLDVKVPLCADHRRRRRNAIVVAWLVALGGIACPIVTSAAGVDSPLPILASVVGVVAGVIIGFAVARPLVPMLIDEGGGTFKGAGEGFLSKLG